MTFKDREEWVVDLEKMECKNAIIDATVKISDDENGIRGRLDDLSAELYLILSLSELTSGARFYRRLIKHAEEVYLRAYNKSKARVNKKSLSIWRK
jgi:hypothetical protein